MARYIQWLKEHNFGSFDKYSALHQWSIDELGPFWESIWKYTGTIYSQTYDSVLEERVMPGARWFPGAHLNFAENLLRESLINPNRTAIVAYAECRERVSLTYGELFQRVTALEGYLRSCGVESGDRVAAVVANGSEAIIGMLATTSIGAIWSSASPEFGVTALVDRFCQIDPKVLICVNGYGFGGRVIDRTDDMEQLKRKLTTVTTGIMVEQVQEVTVDSEFTAWDLALKNADLNRPSFTQLPFDHPIYIVYSSGTTGKPKCITHGAGGTLLQHAKELILHSDVCHDDVLFYHTTTGWMMWNWLVSGLMTGCKLVLFDGSPKYPTLCRIWEIAEADKLTHFGGGARFFGLCRKENVRPKDFGTFDSLRVVLSTGSPLLPEDYDWIYQNTKSDILLASISGGTDIISCFFGGNPMLPVYRGYIQCKELGTDVKAFNEKGESVLNESGELVCTSPIPSMPIYFWNDPTMEKYSDAYFSKFEGVWAHGDFITFSDQYGCFITGRSDAVLNPAGVRIGTAEIYRHVEQFDEIADSLVTEQRWDDDLRIILFVVMNAGHELTDALRERIHLSLRENASPRHTPGKIISVKEIPYTLSGKKVELAVRRCIEGQPVENRHALTNPAALDQFLNIPELTPINKIG